MTSEKSYRFHFLTILSGNTLSQLIPFVIAPFLTRVFTKEDFGVNANWLSIVTLIGIISTGRLEMAIPLPKSNKEASRIFSSGLIFTVSFTLLSLLLIVFDDQIANWYKDPELKYYLQLAPIGVFSVGLLNTFNNWSLRHRKYRRISVGKVVQSIVNNAGALFLGYLSFGVWGLLIAWVVSQFLNAFVLIEKGDLSYLFRRKNFNTSNFNTIVSKYKDFPLVNSLHAFTDIFATQFILFYLIAVYFSKEELGLFFLMHRFVRAPIVLISSSVSQLYYVEASKAIQQNLSGLPMAFKTMKTASIFAIPFLIILLFFAPSIFSWYLGSEWREAGVYAQYLAPMFFLSFFVSPLSGTPLIFNRQKTSFIINLCGYVLTLGSIFLGYMLEYTFAETLILYAISFSLLYFVLLVWYLSLLRK